MFRTRLKTFLAALIISIGLALSLFALRSGRAAMTLAATPAHFPSPTYDPLVVPVLPTNPSDYELGKYQYYYHCMPCHGDLGQGLTDAFRMVWVEDHRNCWGRGCHGGRREDEGFPIPTIIPAIIATDDQLKQFTDFTALQQFLHDTHPPQYPGKLEDRYYHAFAVYLWDENHKPTLTPTVLSSPTALDTATPLPNRPPTYTSTPRPSPVLPVSITLTPPAQPPENPSASSPPHAGLVIAALALFVIICIALAYFISRSNTTTP